MIHAKMLWLAVQIRSFALVSVNGVMVVGLMTVFGQLFQISGPLTSPSDVTNFMSPSQSSIVPIYLRFF